MTKYLLDEHGEVIDEFLDSSRIVVFNELNIKRKLIENKMFYKLYKDSILIFINGNLNKNVEKTLFSLIGLLEFNTNEFVCFNGLPSNLNQLCNYLNLSSKTLYNHLKKLIQLEIIKKVKRGRNVNILINPYFISYGSNNTDESLKIFANSLWSKTSTYTKRRKKTDDKSRNKKNNYKANK